MSDWREHIPTIIGAGVMVALSVAIISVYRPVCATGDGAVRNEAFRFEFLGWFTAENSPLCQNENLPQFVIGQVSETLGQTVGGPDRDFLRRVGPGDPLGRD